MSETLTIPMTYIPIGEGRHQLIVGSKVVATTEPGTPVELVQRIVSAQFAVHGIPTEALRANVVQELVKALKAQDEYEAHYHECEACDDGSICEEGADLSSTAQRLRTLALAHVQGKGVETTEAAKTPFGQATLTEYLDTLSTPVKD